MRTIKFTKEKLFALEKFTEGKVQHFHNLSTPSVTLSVPVQGAAVGVYHKVELVEGDTLHKDSKGNIYKKVN